MNSSVPTPLDVKLMNMTALVLFVAFAALSVLAAARWIARLPAFDIKAIAVVGQVTHNNAVTLRANVAPRMAGTFFSVDLGRVRAAFEAVPWVRNAVVRRDFPNRLQVLLQEHQAVAYWGGDAESRLINSFGLDYRTLTSRNAALPIAYYLFQRPRVTLLGTSGFEAKNAVAVKQWLVQSLLVGAFAGSSDRTIDKARDTIKASLVTGDDFPIDALFDKLAGSGRISRLDERGIEEVLALEYGKPKTFLALKLIQIATHASGTNFHEDHIIPKAHASQNILQHQGVSASRIKQIKDSVNLIGNIQLLPVDDNLEKSSRPFDEWIETRNEAYREEHLIPNQSKLWKATELPEFVRERNKLIRTALMRVCGLEPI